MLADVHDILWVFVLFISAQMIEIEMGRFKPCSKPCNMGIMVSHRLDSCRDNRCLIALLLGCTRVGLHCRYRARTITAPSGGGRSFGLPRLLSSLNLLFPVPPISLLHLGLLCSLCSSSFLPQLDSSLLTRLLTRQWHSLRYICNVRGRRCCLSNALFLLRKFCMLAFQTDHSPREMAAGLCTTD